jgi:hypothetical protein
MADQSKLREGEYLDPSLRAAVGNIASSALGVESDPDLALNKGQLKIVEPPKYNYGSALNEAVMKKAMDKFYDPTLAEGSQKLRHVTNQAKNLQNAAGNVMQIYQLDKQAQQIARQRKAAEDAQRAQVLSSVLGLGGAIAGAAIAGPSGAAVGSQIGNSAGQSYNGSSNIA